MPEKVACSIYVCAVIPRDGESLMDWRVRAPRSLAILNMKPDGVAGTISLNNSIAREALFHDCSREDAEDALRRMRSSVTSPLNESVSLSPERFGTIRRKYIMCQRDRVMPIDTQELACEMTPCESIALLDTGHLPFYASPMMLAAQLIELGQSHLTSA
jgi:hypothetical protein